MTGLLNEHRYSYEAAVTHMVTQLTLKGDLDSGFAQRLTDREEKGTMVFDHSIAIPHGIQFVSNRLVIAIGVLPQALCHKGHEIRIIFLLGLPEQVDRDDKLLIRVYDEIIRISRDEKLLEELATTDSYQHFLQSL